MKKVTICIGSSCYARGNARNVELAEKFLEEHHLTDDVDIDLAGGLCTGNCADGPVVTVDGVVHKHVDPRAMLEVLQNLFPESGSAK